MEKAVLKNKWSDLSESQKRNAIWKVMEAKSIDFKRLVKKEIVDDLLMRSLGDNFEERADSVRKDVYEQCLLICKNIEQIAFVKRTLRIEE